MTKPQDLLARANRALADQTNDVAVVEVAEFIQPVVDVLRFDADLVVASIDHTSVSINTVIFRIGPVPRAELWEFMEIGMSGTSAGPFGWQLQLEWDTDLGFRRMLLTEAETAANTPINLLRSTDNTGGAGPERNSDRSVLVYPGMTLAIHGTVNQAIGDITRFDMTYRRSVANTPRFIINNNENIVIIEV